MFIHPVLFLAFAPLFVEQTFPPLVALPLSISRPPSVSARPSLVAPEQLKMSSTNVSRAYLSLLSLLLLFSLNHENIDSQKRCHKPPDSSHSDNRAEAQRDDRQHHHHQQQKLQH